MSSKPSALGVNSVDAVAFLKEVCTEFNVDIKPEDSAKFESMQAVVDYVEAAG